MCIGVSFFFSVRENRFVAMLCSLLALIVAIYLVAEQTLTLQCEQASTATCLRFKRITNLCPRGTEVTTPFTRSSTSADPAAQVVVVADEVVPSKNPEAFHSGRAVLAFASAFSLFLALANIIAMCVGEHVSRTYSHRPPTRM